MTVEKEASGKRTYDNIGSYVDSRLSSVRSVNDVLARKGGAAYTIKPSASVYDALALMARHNIGALVVTEGATVVGIISERDYARKVILIGKASRETRVREIMSSPARTVNPQTTVAECFGYMTDNRLRHLPVVDGGDLLGVLSIGDLVKFIMEAQELRLEQFERYVQGRYPS